MPATGFIIWLAAAVYSFYYVVLPDLAEIRYVEGLFAKAYPDYPELFAQRIENALA